MIDDEHKPYPLTQLEEWVSDAMESGCTPNEIYDSVVETVKTQMRYHKSCYDDSVRLLTLLRGNANSKIKVYDSNDPSPEAKKEFRKFWEGDEENRYWNGELYGKEFKDALQKYGYEYTPIDKTKFKLDSPHLHNNDEDQS